MERTGNRLLSLSALAGLLASSCVSPCSRSHFEVPDALPLLQIVVDLDSNFERTAHHKKPPGKDLHAFKAPQRSFSPEPQKTANLLFGLIVPISGDGYCLTAAHNLGKGDAMSQFRTQIDQHHFGRSYVMADLARPSAPPFFRLERGGGQIVTASRRGDSRSNRFCAAAGRKLPVKVFPLDLDMPGFETMQNQIVGLDAVYCLPLRTLKVWSADDLALVKVPFPTPSYFTLSEKETSTGDKLMVILNPGMHGGTINHVTKRIERSVQSPMTFSTFYPLVMTHVKIGKQGDSGGPVINGDGELVGINIATWRDADGHAVDIAAGLRHGPVMDAIEESRKRLR